MTLFTILLTMKLLMLLNIGNIIYNSISLISLFIIWYLYFKTKFYTQFKFKNKKQNEKNS